MATWQEIQQGIFAGESGGDYNALFGYQNRPGGIFSDVKVSEMSIADILDFTNPSGAYGQFVANTRPDPEMGVATPVGAYQVVGTTLRDAVKALGIDPSQKFDKATQDRIGKYIFETQGAKAFAGYKGPKMDGQQPTAQQMQQMQQQPRGLMGFLRDPRTRQTLASLDRSGMFQGIAEQATRDITRQEQQREQQQLQNRTAEWLKSQPGGERYAQAILAGVPAAEAYRQYQSEMGGPTVGARKIYGNGTIVQSTNQGQRVFDPTGKLVTGAEAAKVIDEANKYEAEQAQRVAGSKKIGTVTADQAVKAFEKAANVTTSIETIDRAVAAIDDGAMSGFVANYLPNITKASAELQSAMNQMGLDVISTVTFGALSESEMRVAMETAVPRNLSGPQLKEWLIEKRAAQVKARQALERAASYLSVPGNTIASWLELKSGQRQETTTNPYMSKSLQELNEIFARRNELTQSQRDDLIEALKAKKGS
ncbi:MAG: hypothetical protein ACO23H_07870 [Alphaproteobacteria bacterium]